MQAFSGPNYSRNAEKAGDKEPCVICGKAVTGNPSWYVRVDTSNRIHAVSAEIGHEDMGCFPIGRDCLNRNPGLQPIAERWSK